MGSYIHRHVRNTFRDNDRCRRLNHRIYPCKYHEVTYRVNLVLHYIARRIASRYFTTPEVKLLCYPRYPVCTPLLIPQRRSSRD